MILKANGIENRRIKPNHPWTNGHIARMNCTIRDATVKRFSSETHDQWRTRLARRRQLCPKAKDAEQPHTLRIRLQNLDIRAGTIHPKPDLPDAWTKHLGRG
jgi:hypothetical protein